MLETFVSPGEQSIPLFALYCSVTYFLVTFQGFFCAFFYCFLNTEVSRSSPNLLCKLNFSSGSRDNLPSIENDTNLVEMETFLGQKRSVPERTFVSGRSHALGTVDSAFDSELQWNSPADEEPTHGNEHFLSSTANGLDRTISLIDFFHSNCTNSIFSLNFTTTTNASCFLLCVCVIQQRSFVSPILFLTNELKIK